MKQHHYVNKYPLTMPHKPYLEYPRLLFSLAHILESLCDLFSCSASIPQCFCGPEMQQFVVEFYHSLQSNKTSI